MKLLIKRLWGLYNDNFVLILKFILSNYIYALLTLLMIFGGITWFRPERALELIEITNQLTLWQAVWMLLVLNFLWCIGFILFDLWKHFVNRHDNDEVLNAIDELYSWSIAGGGPKSVVQSNVKIIENKLGVRK